METKTLILFGILSLIASLHATAAEDTDSLNSYLDSVLTEHLTHSVQPVLEERGLSRVDASEAVSRLAEETTTCFLEAVYSDSTKVTIDVEEYLDRTVKAFRDHMSGKVTGSFELDWERDLAKCVADAYSEAGLE